MATSSQPNEVTLVAVRLSYPNLFVAKSINNGEPRYSACFLMDKEADAEQIIACRKAMTFAAQEKWGSNIPKFNSDKLALRDGGDESHKDIDGYGPGVTYVSANSVKPFPVVDRNPQVVLTRENMRPYAGCYVNAKIRFWAQDNQWGKRINAQIVAVQFMADGEPFGEAPAKADEIFGDVSDPSDAAPEAGDGGTLLG